MPRVVRVSPLPAITEPNKNELRRIFGASGTIVSLRAADKTVEQLIAEIRREQPDAVFADMLFPPFREAVRELAADYVVLDLIWEKRSAYDRFGRATTERFPAGIARRLPDGSLVRLEDGQLGE